MLNLVKSVHCSVFTSSPEYMASSISQLSPSHCTIQLHSTFQGILSLYIHFPILNNNFESVLNLAYILWELRFIPRLAELHFAHFKIKWSYDHCHIMTKLRLPCDMIGCEICRGRSHAEDHTLSCTGQGGLEGPWCPNNCSKLSHPLPFSWLLKKYTLNTYNCPMSRSPATWIRHTLPLSHRPREWLSCTHRPLAGGAPQPLM